MRDKILFQDFHMHSTYSDGKCAIKDIFEYNNLHDKLDLAITDHVDKTTDWFVKYAKEIKKLRKSYPDFSVKVGCEVKILDESGALNTTKEILDLAEIIIGSVHHFKDIKLLGPNELLAKEYELTKILAANKKIDILGHPFSMSKRMHGLEPSLGQVKEVYNLCVKSGVKFEYNSKSAGKVIKEFVKKEISLGRIKNFSFGSDMHSDCSEIGNSIYSLIDPINVLVTGAGAGVGQSIIKSVKLSKVPTRIIAVDKDPMAAGLHRADAAYLVPLAREKNFINEIINVCKKEKVKLILVGTDVELESFSLNKQKIESATGAKIIVSALQTIAIADDKWKTFKFLEKNGFDRPQSALPKDVDFLIKRVGFPLIVKPRVGARSIGVNTVYSREELQEKIKQTPDPIIQEYLSEKDEEYTCGAFFYEGKNYGVITIKRWLRNGDTYKAVIKRNPNIESFISIVGKKLKIYGPCNFQLRKSKNKLKIFEINARFSGTTGIQSFLGFNVFNVLIQKLFFNRPIKKLSFKNAYVFRYWNEVFTDEKEFKNLKRDKYCAEPSSSLNII